MVGLVSGSGVRSVFTMQVEVRAVVEHHKEKSQRTTPEYHVTWHRPDSFTIVPSTPDHEEDVGFGSNSAV
jgi:hypothetical protein